MPDLTRVLRPAAWLFYVVLVFEILFMISPAALYFYSAYAPVRAFLDRSPATAWLSQFFLPHISVTASTILNASGPVGGLLLGAGALLFAAGAVPLYWAKLRRRGVVSGGVYRVIRHPQYAGLAVMGFGTLLVWPRFLVLVALVTMLFLYASLARWEEARCVERFGDNYRAYRDRTGMFLPRLRRASPARSASPTLATFAAYLATVGVTVALGFALRNYSLTQVAAIYRDDRAILSPARLTETELDDAHRTASTDAEVIAAIGATAPERLIVHVVPEEWYLADLPLDTPPASGGHDTPMPFDRTRYKVLFAEPRTHATTPTGADIVKSAWGLAPIVVAHVDIAKGRVTGVGQPPAHVRWGDIPTPTF